MNLALFIHSLVLFIWNHPLLPAVGKPIGRIFAVNCNFCDNFNKAISSHGQLQVRQLVRKPGWAEISAISTSSMKLDDNLLSSIQDNLLKGVLTRKPLENLKTKTVDFSINNKHVSSNYFEKKPK